LPFWLNLRVGISLSLLNQIVWNALHPGQNATTSLELALRFASAAAKGASRLVVRVTIVSYPHIIYSRILDNKQWKSYKMGAEKITKI